MNPTGSDRPGRDGTDMANPATRQQQKLSVAAGVMNLLASAAFLATALAGRTGARAVWISLAVVFLCLGAFWLNRARRPLKPDGD